MVLMMFNSTATNQLKVNKCLPPQTEMIIADEDTMLLMKITEINILYHHLLIFQNFIKSPSQLTHLSNRPPLKCLKAISPPEGLIEILRDIYHTIFFSNIRCHFFVA